MDNDTEMDNREDDSKRQLYIFSMMGVLTISLCALFFLAFFWFQPDQLSLSDRYFPSATATNTPSPTFTPIPTLTTTSTLTPLPTLTPTPTLNLTATVYPFEVTAAAARQWPILLLDTFDTDNNQWNTGSVSDEYADIEREIKDGKYIWNATAKQGFIRWNSIETQNVGDFSVSVEAHEVRNPNLAEYGVIFRLDGNNNFYYFGINRNHEFFVSIEYNGERRDLIAPVFSPTIRLVGFNHLTVVGNGSRFLFFINDYYVGEMTDDQLKTGTVALVISMNRAADQSVFEFDNVELHVP